MPHCFQLDEEGEEIESDEELDDVGRAAKAIVDMNLFLTTKVLAFMVQLSHLWAHKIQNEEVNLKVFIAGVF